MPSSYANQIIKLHDYAGKMQQADKAFQSRDIDKASSVLQGMASGDVASGINLRFDADISQAKKFAASGLGVQMHDYFKALIMAIDNAVDSAAGHPNFGSDISSESLLKAIKLVDGEIKLTAWDMVCDMIEVFQIDVSQMQSYAEMLIYEVKSMSEIAAGADEELAARLALVKENMRLSVTSGALTGSDFEAEAALGVVGNLTERKHDAELVDAAIKEFSTGRHKGLNAAVGKGLIMQIKDDIKDIFIDLASEKKSGRLTANSVLLLLEKEGFAAGHLRDAAAKITDNKEVVGKNDLAKIMLGKESLYDLLNRVLEPYGIKIGKDIEMQTHDKFSLDGRIFRNGGGFDSVMMAMQQEFIIKDAVATAGHIRSNFL